MKKNKIYIYGSLLSAPFIGILYYLLSPLVNPPQCPLNYTQEQVDTSGCIVGANIGGLPLFIIAAIATWFVAFWFVKKLVSKKTPSKSL
jgi:uncharacterized membrane protein YdjX (TVP38/TMEM64 family)